MGIEIKTENEIDKMRQSGQIVAKVLKLLSEQIKPGMKTKELDTIAENELKRLGAVSSFNGYRGFPANICASINDEIVHGIPGDRVLNEGDIVSLDFGVIYNGFHGDAAITVGVGEISDDARRLIETTQAEVKGYDISFLKHPVSRNAVNYLVVNGRADIRRKAAVSVEGGHGSQSLHFLFSDYIQFFRLHTRFYLLA